MSQPTWERAKELFEAALARPAAERSAFLEGACGGNDELRAEVEQLLSAYSAAGSFLGRDEDVTRDLSTPAEKPGTVIGRYKLLQLIGEGGFGSVYMAEQERPVRRKVALKIIKLGMDTRQVIARFEAERQALALMDHPNIARVLDAGSTEKGRPYFVMELVRGVPITEYCDTNSLSTRERLKLFQEVCGAIQHAHQKGIIHRDLKPSNVMVTLHDGKPVPKVIDFGIAKATNQRLTEKTLFTEYRQFIGTPQYMSPEQAEMSGLDVDTRADIYSLGVLLYELLTGTTPFDPTRLRSMAFSEIHKVIREEDPQKPSTRVSTLGAEATVTAKHRRTDVRTLRRSLSGDLDWIVMKALEKDRTRRYDTANAMLMDIQRHLRNEPVAAGPPGAAYRTRKFLQRNRTAVSVSAVVILALLAGIAAASYGFLVADRQRAAAEEAAAEATASSAFFADMLASVNPMQLHLYSPYHVADLAPDAGAQFSHDVSVADMIERSANRAEEAFEGKPELEATMREILGTALLGLSREKDAQAQFQRALDLRVALHGEDDIDVLRTRVQIAQASDNPMEGAKWASDARRDLERVRGPDDPLTLYAADVWARWIILQGAMAKAESVYAAVYERQKRVLGENHRDTLATLIGWSRIYCWRGDGAGALKLAAEAYDRARKVYSPDDAIVLESEAQEGIALTFLGRDEDAKAILLPSLERHLRVFGDDGPTQELAFGLARAFGARGEEEKEIEYYRWRMDGRHPDSVITQRANWVAARDVGRTLCELGRLDEALDYVRSTDDFFRSVAADTMNQQWRGAIDWILPQTRTYHVGVLALMGRVDECRDLAREEIERRRARADAPGAGATEANQVAWRLVTAFPEDLRDPATALEYADVGLRRCRDNDDVRAGNILDTRARAQWLAGDREGAVETQRTSIERYRSSGAGQADNAAEATVRLVRYLLETGGAGEARAAVADAIDVREAWFPDDPERRAASLRALGQRLADGGFLAPAEAPLRRAVDIARQGHAREELVVGLAELAYALGRAGRAEEAEPLADEAWELYRKRWAREPIDFRPGLGVVPGSDGERTDLAARVKGLIARAYLSVGRLEDAAELSRQASAIRRGQAIDAARLLSAQGRPGAEAEWRRKVTIHVYDGDMVDRPRVLARYEGGLARCLMEQGRWEEAEEYLRRAHKRLLDWCGTGSAWTRQLDARLTACERHELDPWSPEEF